MTDVRTSPRDNFITAILTFITSFAMACAVIGLAAALFPQWNPMICLLFCLLCGILHTISACTGQPRLSLILIPAVVLLAVLYFHSWRTGAEIIAGCAAYGVFYRLQRLDRPRQAVVVGIVIGLAACHLSGAAVPAPGIAACLLCVLTELAGSPIHPNHDHGLRLIPFLILLEAAILFLPAGDAPFDWSFVVRIGNRITDLAQEVIVNVEYRLSSSTVSDRWNAGYGDSNLFGGKFSDSNRIELSLSEQCTRQVLYLSGEEYAGYDSGQWTAAPAAGSTFVSWYLTFLDALRCLQITPEETACFAETKTAAITYQYLRTTDVIRPDKLLRIDDSVLQDMTANDGTFCFRRSQGKGRTYRFTFMDLDYANPYLVEILRNAQGTGSGSPAQTGTPNDDADAAGAAQTGSPSDNADAAGAAASIPTYEQLEETSYRLFGLTLSSLISEKAYESQAGAIFHPDLSAWLDTGDTPERVAQLAQEITENYTDTYDKCRAIEQYLRQYPYTKDVDYRGYVNFIDAFLFEKQTGYCIHYASAMVMMLRSIGIPARLVEGYRYDYSVPSENGFDIPGRFAHTWPEAYLNGFGWVRFEPTAAVASADAYGWNLRVPDPVPKTDTVSPGNADRLSGAAAPSDSFSLKPPPAITEASDSEERPGHLTAWLFFGICIPAVYLLLLLIIHPLLRRYRYHRMEEADRLTAELTDVLWLIRRLYPDIAENQPLLNYAALLQDPTEAADMTEICLACYRIRYRGEAAETDAKDNGVRTEAGKAGAQAAETRKQAAETRKQTAEVNGYASLQKTSLRLRQSLYRRYIDSSEHGRMLRRLLAYISLNQPVKSSGITWRRTRISRS